MNNSLLKASGSRGIAAVEFAIILPFLLIITFGAIDFGRLIHARLVVINVSREAANLASRYRDVTIKAEADDLLSLLQVSGKPLDLDADGKIYITKIVAGASSTQTQPKIAAQVSKGKLNVSSNVQGPHFGLSDALFNHLVFNKDHNTSDLSEITVAEVFYKYRTVTPLSKFIEGTFMPDGGLIIGSKAVF